MNEHKSKIINTEWGMVIGATVTVDIIQGLLDTIVVGVVLNRFIDLLVGFALFFYFKLRGVKMTWQRSLSLVAAFIAELVPVIDVAPLWSLDVLYIFASVKSEEGKLGALAGIAVTASAGKVGGNAKPVVKAPPGSKPPVIETYGKKPPTFSDIKNQTSPVIPKETQVRPPIIETYERDRQNAFKPLGNEGIKESEADKLSHASANVKNIVGGSAEQPRNGIKQSPNSDQGNT